MKLAAIVAVTEENAIGQEGGIPWYLPADLKYMRDVTMGHPIIMGRKTHESIGRSLPGRLNVVISGNPNYQVYEGSVLVNSLDAALRLPEVNSAKKAFIFGGESIYSQAMPLIEEIFLTRVHTSQPAADKFFIFDSADWKLVSKQSHKADQQNPYDYDFCIYHRA